MNDKENDLLGGLPPAMECRENQGAPLGNPSVIIDSGQRHHWVESWWKTGWVEGASSSPHSKGPRSPAWHDLPVSSLATPSTQLDYKAPSSPGKSLLPKK